MAQRVISHHTVNGQIESQAYQGFTQAILTDALGSVVKTSSNDPNLRYTPYGSPLGGSTWVQSLFTWVGSFGYRVTNAKYIESYVRARHYSAKSGAWTTADPLWPAERAYGYANQNPATWLDITGMQKVTWMAFAGQVKHHKNPILPKPTDCKRKNRSRMQCFYCAYESLQKGEREGPLQACKNANLICGSHISCGSCGPCPEPAAPDCLDGTIHDFGEFLRGSSSAGKGHMNCAKSCGGFGVGDKLAHCFKGCMIALCIPFFGATIWHCSSPGGLKDPDEDDIEAEHFGIDIGIRVDGPQECLTECAKATQGTLMY